MDEKLLIPIEGVAERLGITRATLWRRVKQWGLTIYVNPLDQRQRLLDWEEVENAVKPHKRLAAALGVESEALAVPEVQS